MAFLEFLGIADADELTDAGSMLRYLVECAICYDDHVAYPPHEVDGATFRWTEPEKNDHPAVAAELAADMVVGGIRELLVATTDESDR